MRSAHPRQVAPRWPRRAVAACARTLLAAVVLGGAAASDIVPAPPQQRPVLLRGATVHPASGDPIAAGQVLFADGKIQLVAGADAAFEMAADTEVIDLTGKHVYPGMIAANTVLGLTEVPRVRATVDTTEPGKVNANARAQVAVNPDSELLPVTRSNGVLVAQVVPQARSDGLVAGTSAVMALDGWTWEEMTVAADCGVHLAWPRMVVRQRGESPEAKESAAERRKARDRRLEQMRATFEDARAYLKARDARPDTTDTDLRWEAMRPLLEGEVAAFIHANTAAQIRAALAFAAEQGLERVVIVGAQDAWRVAAEMKAHGAAAVISPVNDLPLRRWEAPDTPLHNPRILLEAGVPFCIANSGSTFDAAHERNLPYQAARAKLPPLEALRAVTLYPAQILGVGDRLGSLERGKDATLIITDGSPLDIRTRVERAFIGGREIDLSNKQTKLYEKYQEKYRR